MDLLQLENVSLGRYSWSCLQIENIVPELWGVVVASWVAICLWQDSDVIHDVTRLSLINSSFAKISSRRSSILPTFCHESMTVRPLRSASWLCFLQVAKFSPEVLILQTKFFFKLKSLKQPEKINLLCRVAHTSELLVSRLSRASTLFFIAHFQASILGCHDGQLLRHLQARIDWRRFEQQLKKEPFCTLFDLCNPNVRLWSFTLPP